MEALNQTGEVVDVSSSARGDAARRGHGRFRPGLAFALALACSLALVAHVGMARAVEAIVVKPEQDKIDVTARGELYEGRGDKLQLDVRSDIKPTKVRAWVATSASRDFRSSRWSAFRMKSDDKGYHNELAVPRTGYAAMFGEAVYPGEGLPFYLSTNVKVVGSTPGGRR